MQLEFGPMKGRTDEEVTVSEEQIIGILKEQEAGKPVAKLCRKQGMSDASFYTCRVKYGDLDVPDAKRLEVASFRAVGRRIIEPSRREVS